jgi:release factor glutamine methyltransferase
VLTLDTIDSIDTNINYLVSNPPYISEIDYSELPIEILEDEPGVSLTDRSDGLTFYRKFIELSKKMPVEFKFFSEIGFGQKNKLIELLNTDELSKYRFYKDFNGIDRILEVEI